MSKSWVGEQVARYRLGGYETLVPRSTAPHRRPTQLYSELEDEILSIRKQLDEEGLLGARSSLETLMASNG